MRLILFVITIMLLTEKLVAQPTSEQKPDNYNECLLMYGAANAASTQALIQLRKSCRALFPKTNEELLAEKMLTKKKSEAREKWMNSCNEQLTKLLEKKCDPPPPGSNKANVCGLEKLMCSDWNFEHYYRTINE